MGFCSYHDMCVQNLKFVVAAPLQKNPLPRNPPPNGWLRLRYQLGSYPDTLGLGEVGVCRLCPHRGPGHAIYRPDQNFLREVKKIGG